MTKVNNSGSSILSRIIAKERYINLLTSFITILFLLVVWQAVVILFELPAYILPRPTVIASRVISDFTSGEIIPNFRVTLIEVLVGFLGAAICGIVIGSGIALVKIINRTVYPIIILLQTVPKIAIAPLLIIWFGFGLQSKIITAGLVAFFPILVNVIAGLRTVDSNKLLLMRSLKASPTQSFIKVYLPSILPYLFAGLEVGIIFAVIGAIVGEFIGSSEGLGSLIIQRQANVDVAGVFSVIIYLSIMGTALNVLLRLIAKRFTFWSSNTSREGAN